MSDLIINKFTDWPDEELYTALIRYIRRHSMNEAEWKYTKISLLSEDISSIDVLQASEKAVVVGYLSPSDWYVMTIR